MYPEVLREHIAKCKTATKGIFGVNLPMLYPDIDNHIQIIIEEGVKLVFTSAGNPATYTPMLKDAGITVVHVVSSAKFASKSQAVGVDAVVAEGFEAGGHNGREETTTLCLIPKVRAEVDIPVIAAGGIGTGRSMLAAIALGADGVQIGSRFAASQESSCHVNFKQSIVTAGEGDTVLTLKEVTPVRLIKNKFYEQIAKAYQASATKEQLVQLLGRGRAKQGMFEGNLEEGELEIGQIASQIDQILPAGEILKNIINEYEAERVEVGKGRYNFT